MRVSASRFIELYFGGSVDRALIIRQPHIGKILNGIKTWEMRSTSTKIRGKIGLIESGSGMIVGEVEIERVYGPLPTEHLKHNKDKHQCSVTDLVKWRYAWVLKNAKRYDKPKPYAHPKGAVIWVKI